MSVPHAHPANATDATPARHTAGDVILPLVLFATVVAYLASLPRNLSPADESSYLHEAKRLLDGEVMYRDVFDFITPGFQYLMALLFRVFGATIGTARVAIAVVHGLIAVALYAACRRLGVRPWLAAAAGLVHLTVDQSAWPIASQHWLSTLLCTVLLWSYAGGGVERPAATIGGAVVLGLLVLVQHQRALPMAAGTAAWLVADALLGRHYGRGIPWQDVAARLAVFAGTIGAVSVPALGWIVLRAGFLTTWAALVEFPLSSYGATTHCSWGAVNVMSAWQGSFTFPGLLTWLPLGLVVTISRLLRLVAERRDEATARRLAWLVAFAASSALSIRYFPDFIHIAFIAPAFYAILAEDLEAGTRRSGHPLGGLLIAIVVAGVVLVSAVRLTTNHSRLQAEFSTRVETAFGYVDLRPGKDVELYERIRRLTDETPGVELFVHPALSHLYLMTGARNPTRYSWYASTFEFPDVIPALEVHRPPWALILVDWNPDGPIRVYIRRAYEPPPPGVPLVGTLLRRRPDV